MVGLSEPLERAAVVSAIFGTDLTGERERHAKAQARERRRLAQRAARFRAYGLTVEQYDEMLAAQSGKCKICLRTEPEVGRPFHVDHDHDTGRVRGILCHACNVGLGHFGDSAYMLRAAAEYLDA